MNHNGTRRRIAVVTGASSGIGRATSLQLAAQGFTVIVVARGEEALAELAREIRARNGDAYVEALDASNPQAVDAFASRIHARFGAVDVLVNSAGTGTWRFLDETPVAETNTLIGAPYLAAFNMTRALLPLMLKQKSGVILHVNSPACQIPWPGATGYVAARWALRGLHEALSLDLVGTGVTSCHVVFGKVSSSYFANNPESEERIPKIAQLVRTMTPEECATVLVNLVHRPKRESVHPWMARVFYSIAGTFPSVTRALAQKTGYRRPGR